MELYSAGMPALKIAVDDSVCVDFVCMGKKEFIEKYIAKGLDDGIFNDILSLKPLRIESKMTQTQSGFVQNSKSDTFDIAYAVDKESGEARFEELKSGFKFYLKVID